VCVWEQPVAAILFQYCQDTYFQTVIFLSFITVYYSLKTN